MTTEEFTKYFKGVKRSGTSYKAICPCHADKMASLTITSGNKKPIVKCHAGCNYSDIISAIGLNPQDVYYEDRPIENKLKKYEYYLEQKEGKKIESQYHYRYISNGEYAFSKIRFEGKTMRYGIIQNDRFESRLPHSRSEIMAYYGSPLKDIKQAIIDGTTIYIPEGEKDVDSLIKRGLVAFTYGSATDWNNYFLPLTANANIVILADNDEPGLSVANQIYNDIQDISKSIAIVTPSNKPHGDISDFFEEGHSISDLTELINNATTEIHIDLMNFANCNIHGEPTSVSDERIFFYIKKHYNLFVCGSIPYVYHQGYYQPDLTGSILKTIIRRLIPEGHNLIKSTTINRIYELFLQDSELQKTFDELNKYPSSWICFVNGMFDAKTMKLHKHNPKYFCINQIPFCYIQGMFSEGKHIDSFLNFITSESDEREMLLQFIGLSLTKDTSQQRFLVLNGVGGSGKSSLIKLIESLVGNRNISNVSLKDLEQRFSVIGLMNKLLNSCADLEISALEDTSMLKKLLGEDNIRGEYKGKDSISFSSYAKLIFSTNELPLVRGEKTNGFYRRLLVLTMNKRPDTINPNFYKDLESENLYLLELSVQALHRLYQQGTITVSDSSEKAVRKLWSDSDTTQAFLDELCNTSIANIRTERTTLFKKYEQFCKDSERQSLTKTNFYKSLRLKGYGECKSNGHHYIKGISLQESFPKTSFDSSLQDYESVDASILPFK